MAFPYVSLMSMELRHLRYFCAIADEMHVTRAAARLNVAQPALTQQIKALEAEMQTPLLRRAGRGVELTEAGVAFRREAQFILERVRTAVVIAQETHRGLAGRLAIGLTESASFASPVTRVLKAARERWPQVELSLTQGRSNDLVPALLERRIDIAFIRAPVPDLPGLQWRPFLSEGLMLAVNDSHPLAARETVDLAALAGEPLILPRGRAGDTAMRNRVAAAFHDAGLEYQVFQETPEYVMALNLAAAGIGFALLPVSMTSLKRSGVTYVPLRIVPPLLTEMVVVARAGDPAPLTNNLLDLAAELAPLPEAPD